MEINYLYLFGSLIFVLGIFFLLFSKNFFKKAYFRSTGYQILTNHLPSFTVSTICYPTLVMVSIKVDLADKLKSNFKLKISGHPIDSQLHNPNLSMPKYSNEKYIIEKNCKTGKTYNFRFDPEYQHQLDLEFKDVQLHENKIKIGKVEHELTNNIIGNYTIKIMKIERPYEWMFSVGLSLLTIGTVIFVAGLK